MLKNIIRKFNYLWWSYIKEVIYLYWKYKWYEGYKWINEVRPIFLSEAEEFLSKRGFLRNIQSIENLTQKWASYEASFVKSSSPDGFYLDWTRMKGNVGAANIVENIIDQFSRPYVASVLIRRFGRHHQFTGTLLDFGCHTAAISLSWQNSFANHSYLLLSDLENLPREFVKYNVKKHYKYKIGLVNVDLKNIHNHTIDCILCIHVLEHLSHPTRTFKLLDSKLKSGGILILETPWGGHPFHLEEAPIDWNERGGKELLNTKYIRVKNLNPFISLSGGISGVYKKK